MISDYEAAGEASRNTDTTASLTTLGDAIKHDRRDRGIHGRITRTPSISIWNPEILKPKSWLALTSRLRFSLSVRLQEDEED